MLSPRDKLWHYLQRCEVCWSLFMHRFLPVRIGRSLLLPPVLHHGLVFPHPQPPSLHDAGPFGPGFVLVVGVALQMLPAQPCLLFIVRLLLLVGHALPPGAFRHTHISTRRMRREEMENKVHSHFLQQVRWGGQRV